MAFCGHCDGDSLYGCSYYCTLQKVKAPTQLEKLHTILNQGIEYIYKKALVNFSTSFAKPVILESDEFNVEFTDPYDGMICIICAEVLCLCKCYNPVAKRQNLNCDQFYGHFVDIDSFNNSYNSSASTLTEAVDMEISINNIDSSCSDGV